MRHSVFFNVTRVTNQVQFFIVLCISSPFRRVKEVVPESKWVKLLSLHNPLETTICLSPYSETLPAKYGFSSFCIPTVVKTATKNENLITNKNLVPKMILTKYSACTREIIHKSLNRNLSNLGGLCSIIWTSVQ